VKYLQARKALRDKFGTIGIKTERLSEQYIFRKGVQK